ncbi:hypothetical protein SGCOL_002147 [Colletotrichum sp. CLE4]
MAPSKQSKGKLPEVPKVKQDAKVRKNTTARKNTSAKDHKTPKKNVKVVSRPKNRALIQWRKEDPLLVTLLWAQYICAKDYSKMPWDDIIPKCFTGVTSTAFTQFLARERKRLLKMGYCVPPLPSQAKSLEKDTNLRGYINEPTPENEDAIRPISFNEPFFQPCEGELDDGEIDDAMVEDHEDEGSSNNYADPQKVGESSKNPFRQDPNQAPAQLSQHLYNNEAQLDGQVHENSHPQQQAESLLFQPAQQFGEAQYDDQNSNQGQQHQPSNQAQFLNQYSQVKQAHQEWPPQIQQSNGGNDMQLYMQAIEAWKRDAPPNEARIYVEGLAPVAYHLIQVPESVSGGFQSISGTMYPPRTENGYTTFAIPLPVNLENYLQGFNGQEAGAATPFNNPTPTDVAPGTSSLNEPAFQALSDGSSDVVNGGFIGDFHGEHHQQDDADHHATATGSTYVVDEQGLDLNEFNLTAFDFSQFH